MILKTTNKIEAGMFWSLALNSKQKPGKVTSVKMIGGKQAIQFRQEKEKFILSVPENRPNKYATVFKLEGVL